MGLGEYRQPFLANSILFAETGTKLLLIVLIFLDFSW